MTLQPGTPEFLHAIEAARSIEAVEELREALGYSAAEFCRRADVNESSYSRSKQGHHTPRPQTLRRLRETLKRLAEGGN
jgi:transcriptional regulator with XRE-family HTH domain